MHNTRAVSEVIGYVLIAALILSTISIVYVAGLEGLQETRDEERVNNAQRAYEVLADNLEDIHRNGAPGRSTEIKLADSSLKLDDATVLTVVVENTGAATPPTYSVSAAPIVFSTGSGTELVYTSGAVIRTEPGGGAILRRPPSMLFHDGSGGKTASIPLIETRGTGSMSGSSTILVRSELIQREVLGVNNDPATMTNARDPDSDGTDEVVDEYLVTLTIDTTAERAPVWRDHLNNQIPDALDAMEVDGDNDLENDPACALTAGGTTVECQLQVERLLVSATRMDIQLTS